VRLLENVLAIGQFETSTGELIKSGTTDNPKIGNCGLSFKHLFGGEIVGNNSNDFELIARSKCPNPLVRLPTDLE
jgi:hypothetical protein